MFSLKKQAAKVAHINVREEKHGEEPVVAVDVKVQIDIGNDFLDSLSPGLRAALYAKEDGGLDGVDPGLTVLRFPQMEPLDWSAPLVDGTFVVHGAKKADDLEFGGVKVAKALRLKCQEGGTVALSFQVQVLPDASQVGALSAFLGRKCKVSLAGVEQAPEPAVES